MWLFAILLGCPVQSWTPYCEETRTQVQLDEATGFGFTAAELFAAYSDSWSGVVALDSGEELRLSMQLEAAGDVVVVVDSYPADVPDGIDFINEVDLSCIPTLQAPLQATLRTEDGRLDERLNGTLTARSLEYGTFRGTQDLELFNGSWDLETIDRDFTRDEFLVVDAELESGGNRGRVGIEGDGSNGQTSWHGVVAFLAWDF